VHRAIADGLVQAAHDPSEGGLAVALAELAIAGRLGISVDAFCGGPAGPGGLDADGWLFSESLGRLLLVVDRRHERALGAALAGLPLQLIGTVERPGGLRVRLDGVVVVDLDESQLLEAWQR
jgi:phosphoribosylformylglycinamidine synthase